MSIDVFMLKDNDIINTSFDKVLLIKKTEQVLTDVRIIFVTLKWRYSQYLARKLTDVEQHELKSTPHTLEMTNCMLVWHSQFCLEYPEKQKEKYSFTKCTKNF